MAPRHPPGLSSAHMSALEQSLKVLVTGATGMVGSRLVPLLLNQGHQVTGLVRDVARAREEPSLAGIRLLEGDLLRPETLVDAVAGMDVVIHLAVLGHLNEGQSGADDFTRTNVAGTSALFQACLDAGVRRVVYTSTSAALGFVKTKLIDEHTEPNPLTPYGESKLEADRVVQRFAARGLPVVTLRFTHIYGPGDRRDFLSIIRLIKRGIFPQIGLGPNYYPALYIDDAVAALTLCLEGGRDGEFYIVTDTDPHDTRTIRRLVRKELGLPWRPYLVVPASAALLGSMLAERLLPAVGKETPVRSRNIRNLAAGRRFSVQKAQRELGYAPTVDLEQGIRRAIAWYREQGLLPT